MAIVYAASTSKAHVEAAISACSSGDIVELPVGASGWAGTVAIPDNKVIQIRSALGKSSTIITQLTSAGYGVPCFEFSNASQITGIGFVLDTTDSVGIRVHGQDFRINECHAASTGFNDFVSASQSVKTTPIRGVIYDNTTTNCRVNVDTLLDIDNMNHYLWTLPSWIGTASMVFIEDNIFTGTNTGFINAVDANYGGSYVFRYNTVYNTAAECHSFQSGIARGTRIVEIYNNTFVARDFDLNYPYYIRGGESVIFNNIMQTANGYQWTNPHGFFNDVRGAENRGGVIALANGEWPLVDGNAAETNGTGTHTGSNGVSVLTDSGQSWVTNQWVSTVDFAGKNFSRWITNLTSGARGQITANTATTATMTLTGGSRQTWNAGDTYIITSGYRARDQVGAGADASLSTGVAGSSQWAAQALAPSYVWNNRLTNSSGTIQPIETAADYPGHIVEGRDFYNGTAKPGYTAYTYPHPRRSSGGGSIPTTTTFRRRSIHPALIGTL